MIDASFHSVPSTRVSFSVLSAAEHVNNLTLVNRGCPNTVVNWVEDKVLLFLRVFFKA
jgi:hypothetical protein